MKKEFNSDVVQSELASDILDAVEAPRVATPKARRRRAQQLSDEIGRLAASLVGCIVIGWSCFNLVKNFNELGAAEADGGSLVPAIFLILLFCVFPFAFGVYLLARKTKTKTNSKSK